MQNIFRTTIETRQNVRSIRPNGKIFFIGSCFADSISQKLKDGMMDCQANPYGTSYNPASISAQLSAIIRNAPCKNEDIFYNGNSWVSWLSNTKLFDSSKELIKEQIDKQTCKMHDFVKKADTIAITFGTSWTYKLQTNGTIVANCHKMPANMFERTRLTKDEIVGMWNETIGELRDLNKDVHVIFTVSPIRHVKDTMHGNQVSKAILLEAVDEIVGKNIETSYFEAYELLLDDLRDYRFYADDMIHPSAVAVDYIYEHFAEAYLSDETRQMVKEGQKLTQALNHRPMGSETEYRKFAEATAKRIEEFANKYNIRSDMYGINKLLKY